MVSRKRILSVLLAATMVAGTIVPSISANAEGVSAHVAEFVSDAYPNAFATVDEVQEDGTSRRVEIVPSSTVYFVDCFDNGFEAGKSAAFSAVKNLMGENLLNSTYDQMKTDDNAWGRVGSYSAKGNTSYDVTLKKMTGIYGKNAVGDVIEYDFNLEPGQYTVYAGHNDWWNNGMRSIRETVEVNSETVIGDEFTMSAKDTEYVGNVSFTVKAPQTVKYKAVSTYSQAVVLSWLAVVKTGDYTATEDEEEDAEEGQNPSAGNASLPENFSKPLEDNEGLILANGSSYINKEGIGNVFVNTTHWNNNNSYHATIKDTSVFKSGEFTVLFDVKQIAPTADTNCVDQRVAMTIGEAGTSNNSIHVLSYSQKFGFGTNKGGISTNLVSMQGVNKAEEWNSIAFTYKENEDGTTSAVVYANGVKACEVADLGFKLSSMNNLTAYIARSFDTNYLQQGSFDNIVVGPVALSEADAIAVTAARAAQKVEFEKAQEALPEGLILINGEDVDKAAKNVNGLSYKGFGMLNGNSTSNLLMDYKSEAPDEYWEMMRFLFGGENPIFTHIKMEMGNDGNNSTGSEACTMRYENEQADASRSPGFAMAADAKTINPDVKISILRWCMPTWVENKWNSDKKGAGYEAMYKWYSETIFDAYEKYGYVLDFVNPDTNETGDPDEDFIKWFSNRVKNENSFPAYFTEEAKTAYRNIRIIASDENKGLQIVPSMRADKDVYDAVDIIGFHYRTDATDDYNKMADVDDKEVWYSEGCATFGYTELQENKTTEYGGGTIGGYQSPLALMDSFINAFEGSRRTHYIFQPAVGSFYEGLQYGHKELISARDPWSGYIHYDPAVYMLEHFTAFANTGWENSSNSNGIYRVIANATDGSFNGATNEHETAGINGNASYMTLAAPDKKNFTTVFVNNTKNDKSFAIATKDMAVSTDKLHIWTTVTDSYLKDSGFVEAENGYWMVNVPAYSVVTATTLVDVTPMKLDSSKEELHIADRKVLDTDKTGKNANTEDDYLYADDFDYKEEQDLFVSKGNDAEAYTVDYLTARGNEPRYMLDSHAAFIVENGKLKQELNGSVRQWNGGDPMTIVGDFRWMDYTTSIDVTLSTDTAASWVGLGARTQTGMAWNQDGYTLRIYGNGAYEVYRAGTRIGAGSVAKKTSRSYKLAVSAVGANVNFLIDGVAVFNYTDASPFDAGRVKLSSSWSQNYFDNLEVKTIKGTIPYATSMIDGQDDLVKYDSNWSSPNPGSGSADNWYRTITTNTASNAEMTFDFAAAGTGFSIIGGNSAGTVLDVYVDGTKVAEDVKTNASSNRYAAYTLGGLEMAKHQVKVVVKSGTLKVDGIYTLGERLAGGEDAIVDADISKISIDKVLIDKTGKVINLADLKLPKTIDVVTAGGEKKNAEVTWSASTSAQSFAMTAITGTIDKKAGCALSGYPYTVSIPVMAINDGTVYYIDSTEAVPATIETTDAYEQVKAFVGDQLINKVYDQFKTDDTTWGLVDQDAGRKDYTSTDDAVMTGLYGHYNMAGETLSYALSLKAGSYRLVSAHHEWWNQNRPMVTEITYDGNKIDGGNIALTGSSGDIIKNIEFTLEKDTTITYTITATGSQAPVISYLAVIDLGISKEVVEKDDEEDGKDDKEEGSDNKDDDTNKPSKPVKPTNPSSGTKPSVSTGITPSAPSALANQETVATKQPNEKKNKTTKSEKTSDKKTESDETTEITVDESDEVEEIEVIDEVVENVDESEVPLAGVEEESVKAKGFPVIPVIVILCILLVIGGTSVYVTRKRD